MSQFLNEIKSNSNGDSGLSNGENILERSQTVIIFAYKVNDHNMNLNISNQNFPAQVMGYFIAVFLTVCLHVFFYFGTNMYKVDWDKRASIHPSPKL